jgi:small neutral amino acid transporter SnatA (MarC family)
VSSSKIGLEMLFSKEPVKTQKKKKIQKLSLLALLPLNIP